MLFEQDNEEKSIASLVLDTLVKVKKKKKNGNTIVVIFNLP